MVCKRVNVRAPGSAATQDVVSTNESTPTARDEVAPMKICGHVALAEASIDTLGQVSDGESHFNDRVGQMEERTDIGPLRVARRAD